MALMPGALREALVEAGATPEKANKAAEEAASYESAITSLELRMALEGRVNLLTWMVGFVIALCVANLFATFQVLRALP